jgi:hypothetical protein
MHLMPSHKHKRQNMLAGSASRSEQPARSPDDLQSQRRARASPIMLSDSLQETSSDEISFDEDDMYGSNSGVETYSLKPVLQSQQSHAFEGSVCTFH